MVLFTLGSYSHRHPLVTGAVVFGGIFCILTALNVSATCAWAQEVGLTPPLAPSSPSKPVSGATPTNAFPMKTYSKSGWQDLTPAQQLSLKPLAAKWGTLGEAQKRKWIAIAANYPNLSQEEQVKLHSRMTEWVSLSHQQRDQARLNFADSKQLTPSQKTATWEAYQALSPDEKKKLAISARPKPAGAAIATKPVPPKKLATIPLIKETQKESPKISAAKQTVNKNTLLPHPPPPLEAASAPKK